MIVTFSTFHTLAMLCLGCNVSLFRISITPSIWEKWLEVITMKDVFYKIWNVCNRGNIIYFTYTEFLPVYLPE